MKIDQTIILEHLQYERDSRWKDLMDGGYSKEECISPIKDWTDDMLISFIAFWVFFKQENIEQYWKNYSDDIDLAVKDMCWEDLMLYVSNN
jgi:hypothetical protein